MKSRSEVIALVREKIRLRHYSLSTEDVYCGWIARYYDFSARFQISLSPERKAEAFLTDLVRTHRVAARTQNQAFAALLFLYREVLGRPLESGDALRAKRPVHQRTSPSREQVRALRAAVEDTAITPVRLLVDLLYGCGLRISEPLELRVKDILWGEGPHGHLVVRGAKGGKDRWLPIPKSCVAPLRNQIDLAQSVWGWDRKHAPEVGVTLPYSLAEKYPRARFQWQWFWIFPAHEHCTDPRSDTRVRYHIMFDSLQRGVQRAAARAGLDGLITPDVLRHAYATHSKESIGSLKQLLGHSSVETTAGYLHPVVDRAGSPLDDLLGLAQP